MGIKCPVCGKTEFAEKDNFEICSFCGWENEDYFEAGGANKMSLGAYRRAYYHKIEDDSNYVWDTSLPRESE